MMVKKAEKPLTPLQIRTRLMRIMVPYYKAFPTRTNPNPDFRRKLSSSEIEELLGDIHQLILDIEGNKVG